MEDDKLKDLFGSFQPQLSSDTIFLSKLKQNMDAVELVKKQITEQRQRNKIAVVVAAVIGFVSGVVMTLLVPSISNWLSSIQISMLHLGINLINFDSQILAWMMTAAISGLIAYNTYQVMLSKLSDRLSTAKSLSHSKC